MDFANETSLQLLRAAAQAQHLELGLVRAQRKEGLQRIDELSGTVATLTEENAKLVGAVATLAEANAELQAKLADAEARVAQQAKALFGPKSERRAPRRKEPPAAKAKEPQTGHGPREHPDLEVREVDHELAPDERACPECAKEMRPMGGTGDVSELISVTTRAFVRELHRCMSYYCDCNAAVLTAPGPLRVVPGGRYSPAFAVEVAVAKFCDHLPYERQVQIMRRDGLAIDSQTLWDQVAALVGHLKPTYMAIVAAIQAEPVIHADETRWPVMANGKTKENKLFQAWAIVSPALAAFRILDSRGKDAATTVLGDFQGVLMADGYTVYQSLANQHGGFVVANCWSHARRKFVEAEPNFPEEAGAALAWIRELYAVEREATDATRAELRAARAAPAVDALMAWARETQPRALAQSGIAKAIGYLLNLEAGLRRYLTDTRVPIDNNPCERALRALALGRKNHYGSRSRAGTEAAAITYTLVESAKLAGVSPRAYLLAVTERAIREPGAVLLPGSFAAELATIKP